MFDTKTMKISVPKEKLAKLATHIRQADGKTLICQWIESLVGKITVLLHIQYL